MKASDPDRRTPHPRRQCRPYNLRRVAGWYAVCFGLLVVLEGLGPLLLGPSTAQLPVQVATAIAGWVWCLRNFLVMPWLGLVARLMPAPRLVVWARPLRIWTVACAVAFGVSVIAPTTGLDHQIVGIGTAVVIIGWTVAWPVYLLAFGLRLRRIEKDMAQHGPPRLIAHMGAAAEGPAPIG